MAQRENNKKRVAVLLGGKSTEHRISLRSSINIIRAINRKKYDLTLIGIDKYGRWMLCDEQDYLLNADDPAAICLAPARCYLALVPGYSRSQLIDVTSGQIFPAIDVAFSVLHGSIGENGSVQGLLQVLNIPYAGSNVLSSAICMDKDITKRILRGSGIPVTPSMTLLRTGNSALDVDAIINQFGLPLFIKPASQGSSIGVSKVTDRVGFEAALALAFCYDTKVLIEKGISGREIEIALLGNDSPEISVCGEILTQDEFYNYDTKYLKVTQTELIIPAPLPTAVANALRQMAHKAYLALGCSVTARIDFFLTNQGEIFLNEVNTLPGFTLISMYPKLWEASGIDYYTLVDRLITLGLARTATIDFNQIKF